MTIKFTHVYALLSLAGSNDDNELMTLNLQSELNELRTMMGSLQTFQDRQEIQGVLSRGRAVRRTLCCPSISKQTAPFSGQVRCQEIPIKVTIFDSRIQRGRLFIPEFKGPWSVIHSRKTCTASLRGFSELSYLYDASIR